MKASEEKLLTERKVEAENLKMQEQRYEKMKSHAMMQLEMLVYNSLQFIIFK